MLLVPNPFDPRTPDPPLPVPLDKQSPSNWVPLDKWSPSNSVSMDKWSPKIWSPWTNDPQPIDGNSVKIKVADQESNVTMVSFSGTFPNLIVFIISFSIYNLLTQVTNASYTTNEHRDVVYNANFKVTIKKDN